MCDAGKNGVQFSSAGESRYDVPASRLLELCPLSTDTSKTVVIRSGAVSLEGRPQQSLRRSPSAATP
jgi:hypothetical protein